MLFAWCIFFDPGTQTGLAADGTVSHRQRLIAAIFSICGFVFNLFLLGVVVDKIRTSLNTFESHNKVIIANGHFVVLGWSERTLFLLAEAAQMLSDRDEQGGEIVVLTEMDEQQMFSEVAIVYPDWRRRWPKVVLRYMQGKPYEIADLMRVSVYAAHHVMVLGLSRRPREADSQVINAVRAALPSDLDVAAVPRGGGVAAVSGQVGRAPALREQRRGGERGGLTRCRRAGGGRPVGALHGGASGGARANGGHVLRG